MRFLLSFLFVVLTLPAFGDIRYQTLVAAKTTTGAGSVVAKFPSAKKACQAYGTTSAGSGASVITIQGSNDNSNYIDLGAITLVLGTTATTDGFTIDSPWVYTRGYVTSISGTTATVSLICTYEYNKGATP